MNLCKCNNVDTLPETKVHKSASSKIKFNQRHTQWKKYVCPAYILPLALSCTTFPIEEIS